MSDLSNLLGAVYGSSDPDGPSTPHEPSAAERAQAPEAAPQIDDDLAAALSAALVTSTPTPNVGTPAPMPAAPQAAAPMPAAPEPVAVHAPEPAYTPTYSAAPVSWSKGDDDIFPSSLGKKR